VWCGPQAGHSPGIRSTEACRKRKRAKRSAAMVNVQLAGADRGSGWRCRREVFVGQIRGPNAAKSLGDRGVGKAIPSAPGHRLDEVGGRFLGRRDDQRLTRPLDLLPARIKMAAAPRANCGIVQARRCDHETEGSTSCCHHASIENSNQPSASSQSIRSGFDLLEHSS